MLDKAAGRLWSTNGQTWTVLAVRQTGGGPAANVRLKVKVLQPGHLEFYNLRDIYERRTVDDEGLPTDIAAAPSAELNLGTMEPGTTTALPLFLSDALYEKNTKGGYGELVDAINLSAAFVPDQLQYRDSGSTVHGTTDVRRPSERALAVTSAVTTAG